MTPSTTHARPRAALDRVLATVADVRAGEGRTAWLMCATVFLVMCAYYLVKPLREGWIATTVVGELSRVEIKAYSSLAQSVLLLFAVGLYGRLAARWPRRVLVMRTSCACAVMLVGFFLLQPDLLAAPLPGLGIVFYLWVGMFGVLVVAQFWAFATDLYGDDQGRRLLPLIAVGGTAGAAAGSYLHGVLVAGGPLWGRAVLLIATVPLAASALLARRADVAMAGRVRHAAARVGRHHPLARVLSDRFLLAAGVLALLLSWASTNGENLLFHVVQETVARDLAASPLGGAARVAEMRAATTAFYGEFYCWTNLVALAVQILFASRLLRRGGLAAVLLALPLLALLVSAVLALAPALALVKWLKVAEQATDYSLNQTARQVVWLPATPEMKYESKPTIDGVFVRLGDGLAALTVLAAGALACPPALTFAALNVVLVAAWIATVVVLLREHGRLAARGAGATAVLQPTVPVRATLRAGRAIARGRVRTAAAVAGATSVLADALAVGLHGGRGHPPPAPA